MPPSSGYRSTGLRSIHTTEGAEKIHAEGHLKSTEGVGTTALNLQAAIDGETHEYTRMYPPMLKQAEADNHKAKRMFGYAVEAEAVHAKLYAMALGAAKNGKDLTGVDFSLCPVCGYIELGKPTKECPVCGTKAERFVTL